jgi:hypothetical protein
MIASGQLRSILPEQTNVNDEQRTVELTWSTGYKGLRQGWDGSYYEELSMSSEHVDLSRLQTGAPLLAAHDSFNLDSVIGVVERAWIDGNEGKAIVRFSSDAESDKIYQKVKEKVLRNVSIGYQVRKYEDVTPKGEKIPTFRAVKWQPHEISIVPIGFDPNAQVRSQELNNEVEIVLNEITIEPIAQSNIEPSAQELRTMTDAEKKALADAAKKEAVQAEKQRQSDIRLAVRSAKLEDSFAEELITNDVSIEEARKLVIEKMSKAQPEPVRSTITVTSSEDNQTKRREAFENALLHRMNPKNFKLDDASKEFHGKGLLRSLEMVIPRYSMESDQQYARRTMSSSDLPLALANIAEKSLQKQYELQPRTFEKWTRPDSLRNYKEHSQVKSGDYGSLVERPEGDEFQMASFGEDKEVVQLKDYGIIHAFTSQMLVNDDLSVISRLASSGGIAVSRLENRLAYLALLTNKTMNDGTALYHADHGNLGTAGAISETSVAEAYKFMRKQTSTDGLDPLNLYPKFLICGPDKEVEARKFLSAIIPNQTANVNVFQNSMELIVDAQITGNQYYFACDPSIVDTVVCYRLQGQEQPSIESRVKFETNSLELKIAHAFAAAPMDWRGLVKNAGN